MSSNKLEKSKKQRDKLKEYLDKLSKEELPKLTEKSDTPSIKEILMSFKEYISDDFRSGDDEYFIKFCLGIVDYLDRLFSKFKKTVERLNSYESYINETAYKQNLSKFLRLLNQTNANQNVETLRTMLNNVDKLFLKLYITVVFDKKIKHQECSFDDHRIKYFSDTDPNKKNKENEFQNFQCSVSRYPNKRVLMTGGQYGHNFKKVSQSKLISVDDFKPTKIQQLPVERQKHAMINVDNQIQLGGGTNDRKTTLNDFQKLDLNNMQWEELDKMLNKRESFYFCDYRSKFILVGGGFNGIKNLESVEIYNIKLNKWSQLNIRLPKIDIMGEAKIAGWERIGLAIDTTENRDELQIFGGSQNLGDNAQFNERIYKVSMNQVFEVDCDPKLDINETAESQREYLFESIMIKYRNETDEQKCGHIRMFEKIGSKIVFIMVRHDQEERKRDGSVWEMSVNLKEIAIRSAWQLQVFDFEDQRLERMKIEDQAKEKKGNNPEELSVDDEVDVYAACLTY